MSISRMPEAAYRALDALNWSWLKLALKSPQHFRAGPESVEDTPALRLGRAAHVACLEPDDYAARYTTWTGGVRRGKEWDAFAAQAAAAGVEVLTADEAAQVDALAVAVRTHDAARAMLSGGQAEATVQWELGGRPCKARLDYFLQSDTGLMVVDLKTAQDASPGGFGRACVSSGYLGQAAWYADAVEAVTGEAPRFFFVAVEKSRPHVVGVYEVDEVQLDVGRRLYMRALRVVRECEETGKWDGYTGDGVAPLLLPAWAYTQEAGHE